jgi:putative ABC transport system permease protein
MTKKARTFLTAFAGSIGIIGIALILSLSNGFQLYIDKMQEDTLSTYPLQIQEQTADLGAMMGSMADMRREAALHDATEEKVYSLDIMGNMANVMSEQMGAKNDLASFKTYMDAHADELEPLTNAISYNYNVQLNIFKGGPETVEQVYPAYYMAQIFGTAPGDKSGTVSVGGSEFQMGGMSNMSLMSSGMESWTEMLDNQELLQTQYDVVKGKWPENYDEIVLVVDDHNQITDFALLTLGLRDPAEIDRGLKAIISGEDYIASSTEYSFDELMNLTYKIVPNAALYQKQGDLWHNMSDNSDYMRGALNSALTLKVVGILRPTPGAAAQAITGSVGYLPTLTKYLMMQTDVTTVVRDQLAKPAIDIFTGKPFDNGADTAEFDIVSLPQATLVEFVNYAMMSMTEEQKNGMAQMAAGGASAPVGGGNSPSAAFDVSALPPEQLAILAAAIWQSTPDEQRNMVKQMYAPSSSTTFENNLIKLGMVDENSPSSISIYPVDFASKDALVEFIDRYNEELLAADEEAQPLRFTDYIGLLMSSISSILTAISAVLIAFVGISLVVSSLMIGIITYVSVLERTKEIGILKSIGASKRDIRGVFNAETLIVGLTAGLIGIGVTLLINIPANMIINYVTNIPNVSQLPIAGGVILILLSCALTLIAGLIPSGVAAKKDPVVALRTD